MRSSKMWSGVMLIALLAWSSSAEAQSRQSGPWWPNAEWGPDDQAGASNRITPEKVVAALRLATTGKIYELGQIYEPGMPSMGNVAIRWCFLPKDRRASARIGS